MHSYGLWLLFFLLMFLRLWKLGTDPESTYPWLVIVIRHINVKVHLFLCEAQIACFMLSTNLKLHSEKKSHKSFSIARHVYQMHLGNSVKNRT